MEQLRYLDFDLKIEQQGDGYKASVLRSPGGEGSNSFTLPLSEDRIDLLVQQIGGRRSLTRGSRSKDVEAARELGGNLFHAVFEGQVRDCFNRSLDAVEHKDATGLRLKLRLQDVPELADLPWEFLLDTSHNRFLARSVYTPIVRYIEKPESCRPQTVNLPLMVLVMISSPVDPNYDQLDVEHEKSLLQEALAPLCEAEKVQLEWLEEATLPVLQRRLRETKYHIFHFIGHGRFDQKTEEGVLIFEDEQKRGRPIEAQRISTLLHDHRSLQLVVLNSCEGARNSRTDPFAGVATSLIWEGGIPAVVAMQFEITDKAALGFASEFYHSLAEGLPVDSAVAEARKAIYSLPNDVEWGTPVLYTRAPDGVLFDVQSIPQPVAQTVSSSPKPAEVELPTDKQMSLKESSASMKTDTVKIEISSEGSRVQPATSQDPLWDKVLGHKTILYKHHKIEIKPLAKAVPGSFGHKVLYDGKEVSRKMILFPQMHHFPVSEDGEEVQYEVKIAYIGSTLIQFRFRIKRNGEVIFTDFRREDSD